MELRLRFEFTREQWQWSKRLNIHSKKNWTGDIGVRQCCIAGFLHTCMKEKPPFLYHQMEAAGIPA